MKTTTEQCLDTSHNVALIPAFDLSAFGIDLLSSIVTESCYVIDVSENRFCYVSSNDFFLCGHSVEDVLALGLDFYKVIVHPEDLSLWKKMYHAVIQYYKVFETKRDEIEYFSCTFRMHRKYSFCSRPLPQMVCHKMKPVWEDDEMCYLICTIGSTTIKEAGNLLMHNKDGLTFEKYNSATYRWKRMEIKPITERDKAILMLSIQDYNAKEIADNLHRSHHTIRSEIKALFEKLEVNSMQEAVDFASYHRLIYASKQVTLKPIEVPPKRTRGLITVDMLHRIQKYLDDGMSIRHAAKMVGVTEGAIRYKIKQGKLHKKYKMCC